MHVLATGTGDAGNRAFAEVTVTHANTCAIFGRTLSFGWRSGNRVIARGASQRRTPDRLADIDQAKPRGSR